METPRKTGRDPVCESIESLLREFEADGKGSLEITEKSHFVRLGFREFSVEAETLEIALVRLANRMMDDPIYAPKIMSVLRPQVQCAD